MDSPNPRRRQFHVAPPSLLSGSAFKKGATFHSPTSPKSQEHDPILNISTLPQRSSTCVQDLEAALAAGQSRVLSILGAVDRTFSSLAAFSEDSQETILAEPEPEPEPVPQFMIDAVNRNQLRDAMDIDAPVLHRKHHASDSGIGSTETSEASINEKPSMLLPHSYHQTRSQLVGAVTSSNIESGINGSSTVITPTGSAAQHVLSEYACKQIQKHIILPIIREEKLKPFHSLVHGLPYRVARKEITCLRDLEKVILWLAPVSDNPIPTMSNVCSNEHGFEYLLSMFVGKRCLRLSDCFGVFGCFGLIFWLRNGQRLGNPFFSFAKPRFSAFTQQSNISAATILRDLRIDHILTATSSISSNRYDNTQQSCLRKEPGLPLAQRPAVRISRAVDDKTWIFSNDDSADKLTLVGGLSQTGRPAELVRAVNGKSISLRTGEEVNMEDYKTSFKRSSEDDLDDDLERSMARRKKNAIRVDEVCKECGKYFKRPCDLTKHEKTHSRPWKCDEVGCKYHTHGWPTEKERDRHMNDKHSAAPKMYTCQYSPCPYESKRESNCKQHMEKAHGYIYVRAKNNGKTRTPSTIGAPTTPQMSTPGSHAFSAPTPDFSDAQSINEGMDDNRFGFTELSNMDYLQQATNFGEIFGPASNDFNFAGSSFDYTEAGPSNFHPPSYDSNAVTPPVEQDSIFGNNFDWGNATIDFNSFNAQIPTPALTHEPAFTSRLPSVTQSPPSACISPHGQADAMLFSPIINNHHYVHDEGYSGLTQGFPPLQDFSLYGNASSATIRPGVDMFGELPNYEKSGHTVDSQTNFFDEIM